MSTNVSSPSSEACHSHQCCPEEGATQADHVALLDLAKGQSARIHSIHALGELGRRLRDMGLLPGVELTVTGRAPLGCPLSVSLDGYDLSLRCEEAKHVWIERTGDAPRTKEPVCP